MFGKNLKAEEVKAALLRLVDLDLLKVNSDGTYIPTYSRVTTKDDVVNEGARIYHRKVSELAIDSIQN